MARLECRSSQRGVPSAWVEVDGITDAEVAKARNRLDKLLLGDGQISTSVATAFLEIADLCPRANPSDLWQHVIYRHLLESGWSDQRWKRVSGFALERAFVLAYSDRLLLHGIRMRILAADEANRLLEKLGLTGTKATKVDVFIEGMVGKEWLVFGAAHVKSSIAERIQDDVPASLEFKSRGLLSIALTMDSKSYPPPHGNCVNYGELGGRSVGIDKDRLKRGYIEIGGQFDALFSFNLRTPESLAKTQSGKRIFAMSLHDRQPDKLVKTLIEYFNAHRTGISI